MTGPYPPPSNQSGDGTWQGGDINSPFGFGDATQGPDADPGRSQPEETSPYEGVQYELEGPAGRPPGYDPHSNPVTGVPMTGPPHMSAPHMSAPPMSGPGYPPQQPGYGQPPPFQPGVPIPSSSGGNGWLIGGVVAGVVILLAVAAVIVVITAGDDDSGETTADPTTSQTSEEPDEDENEDDPDEDQPGTSGTYRVSSTVCGDIDLTGFTEQDPELDSLEEGGYDQRAECTRATEAGDLYMMIESHPDNATAQDDFEFMSDLWLASREDFSEPSGPWELMVLGEENEQSSSADYALSAVAIDGNLVVTINWYAFGAPGDQAGAVDTVLASVEEIMQLTST